jgi:site-specific recombinase XerD
MARFRYVQRTEKVHKIDCTEKDKPRNERKRCDCPTFIKTDGKGDGTIFLRITAHGKAGYISTKIAVQPKQWDQEKMRVRKNHVSSSLYNERLRNLMHRAETFNDDDKTVGNIKKALAGNGGNNFVDYAQGVIQSVRSEGQYWNGKNLETALNKLISYEKSDIITFKQITPEYIRNFRGHLHGLGNKTNTISKTLGSLKQIFNIALNENKIKIDENPFRGVKLEKEKSNKQKLTDEEIDKIVNLELPEYSLIWHVRNYFMFSFFSGGMRFIDLSYLQWDDVNENILTYTMSKTAKTENKTTLEFELLPPAANILEYYGPPEPDKLIFPILPDGIEDADIDTQKKILSAKNALVNKYLVKIQERAGIWQKEIKVKDEATGEIKTNFINSPRLSMHISRHSFAYYAMRHGMHLFEIQAMLGHSSAVITETYLKSLSPKSISTALKTTFKKYVIPGDKKISRLQANPETHI